MSFLKSDAPVWIAGCGNMGGAMLRRWLASGMTADRVTVIDPAPASIDGVKWVKASPKRGSPGLLVLGVKPQMLDALVPDIAGRVTDQTVIISMMAGVEVASLAERFPQAQSIVRIMPNLPVALGKGVTGLYAVNPSKALIKAIDGLMKPLGLAEWLAEEAQLHTVTALSGSGPAFVYRFIAALGGAGAALGLPEDQALRFATAMVDGAAALAHSSEADPAELARRVTSPGGTTASGLDVLDADGVLPRLIRDTLRAAAQRSAELAADAKR